MAETKRKPARKPVDARTRKMRAVLAACRRLGLDSEARKDLQLDVIGVTSMSSMDEGQLGQLLDHLNRDWKGPNPDRAHIGKIKALWWSLYWVGAINDPGDGALSAFVKRQTSIDNLRFLDHRKAPSVIEALKSWLAREGVVWPEDSGERARPEREAVIAALKAKLRGVGVIVAVEASRTSQLDEAIRTLGKLWREKRP